MLKADEHGVSLNPDVDYVKERWIGLALQFGFSKLAGGRK